MPCVNSSPWVWAGTSDMLLTNGYSRSDGMSPLRWGRKETVVSILESLPLSPCSGESKLQHLTEAGCAGNSPLERSMWQWNSVQVTARQNQRLVNSCMSEFESLSSPSWALRCLQSWLTCWLQPPEKTEPEEPLNCAQIPDPHKPWDSRSLLF